MLVAIHRHKPLVEDCAPNTLLNTEFHSVAARSANAFLSPPGAPFRGMGVRESRTPFVDMEHPETESFSSLCQQKQERGTLLSLPTRGTD